MSKSPPPTAAADSPSVQAEPPLLMTIDELIAYLRLDVDCTKPRVAVRNLVRRNQLPVLHCGRKWRFRRADVDAWLEGESTGRRMTRPARLVETKGLRTK